MAKTIAAAAEAAITLSKDLRKQIDNLRKPFSKFATAFGKVYEDRKELAPVFMATFIKWQGETGITTFVRFVQELDPTVPADRNGYREHPSYQAAEYMRRLSSRRDTGGAASRPTRSPGLHNLARLLKTVVVLYKDQETLWRAVAAELELKPRQVTNLRAAVDEVEPLLELPKIKQIDGPAKVIHMPTRAERVEAARHEAPAAEPARGQVVGMATGTARRGRSRRSGAARRQPAAVAVAS